MLNRRNFQSQKTKDSAWLSYTFLYRISNAFDPTVKGYVISERPSYAILQTLYMTGSFVDGRVIR